MKLRDFKQFCDEHNIIIKPQTCKAKDHPLLLVRKVNNNVIYRYNLKTFEELIKMVQNFRHCDNERFEVYFKYNTGDLMYYYFYSSMNPDSKDSYVCICDSKSDPVKEHSGVSFNKLSQSSTYDIILYIHSPDKSLLKNFSNKFMNVTDDMIGVEELINLRDFSTVHYHSCFLLIEEGNYNLLKMFKLMGKEIIISDVIYSKQFHETDIGTLIEIIPIMENIDLDDFIITQ